MIQSVGARYVTDRTGLGYEVGTHLVTPTNVDSAAGVFDAQS